MGRKPSMFSRNYRRQLRKRRIKIATTVIVVIAVVFVAGVFVLGNVDLEKIISSSESNKSDKVQTQESITNNNNNNKENESEKTDSIENTKKEVKLSLPSGEEIILEYDKAQENKDNEKEDLIINSVKCDSKLAYVISPEKRKVVIYSKDSMSIYLIDKDQKVQDITYKAYVSTDGQKFTKESVLSVNKGYIWCENPTFIDEDHIAYASQLPWINEEGKLYLWIYDTTSKNHRGYYNISGKTMTFGEASEKGVSVKVDGNEFVVTSSGTFAK